MTHKETAVFLGILKEAYPRFYADKNEGELRMSIKFWEEFLSDVTFAVAIPALKRFIATNKWLPTVADIREAIAEISYPPLTDASEAWFEVTQAIGRYGYNNHEEAYKSMSDLTLMAVKRMGWRKLCMSDNDISDRSNFNKIYEGLTQRIETERLIPANVQQSVLAVQGTLALPAPTLSQT